MLQLMEKDFQRIEKYMLQYCGINLHNKKELIESRLSFDLHKKGYRSYEPFLMEALHNPDSPEHQLLIDKLSTNHTYFFREKDCLEHLQKVALPELVERGAHHIDIWSAACSSGQECYTAAMLVDSFLRENAPYVTYSFTGWDINNGVLETARQGVYPNTELDAIPEPLRERYTRPHGQDSFMIVPELLQRAKFENHNLVKPFFIKDTYQVIFCRNVMIYFQPETRKMLTQRLHDALSNGCYLYIGATEFVDREQRYFKFIAPSIYQKGGVGIG